MRISDGKLIQIYFTNWLREEIHIKRCYRTSIKHEYITYTTDQFTEIRNNLLVLGSWVRHNNISIETIFYGWIGGTINLLSPESGDEKIGTVPANFRLS